MGVVRWTYTGKGAMQITLNHTIVDAHDNVQCAEFYARIFDFEFLKVWGDFAVVRINDTLTFDFVTKDDVTPQHYAFKVTDEQFDAILTRVTAEEIPYRGRPQGASNNQINRLYGGRGFYFSDPSGHDLEVLTADYDLEGPPGG